MNNLQQDDYGKLLLRLSLGLTMLVGHGLGKLMKYTTLTEYFPDPLNIGSGLSLILVIFSEVFCSLLIILGIGTRLACIPLMITMGVAFFIFHSADVFSTKELPLIYLLALTSIFILGSGGISFGSLVFRKCCKEPRRRLCGWFLD